MSQAGAFVSIMSKYVFLNIIITIIILKKLATYPLTWCKFSHFHPGVNNLLWLKYTVAGLTSVVLAHTPKIIIIIQ